MSRRSLPSITARLTILTVFALMLSMLIPSVACAQLRGEVDFSNWRRWRVPVNPRRVAEIASVLGEKPQLIGFPIVRRDFWDRLAKEPGSKKIIKGAEYSAKQEVPKFPKKEYDNFKKRGNSKGRKTYSRTYRKPIVSRFNCLVLAECLENKGRFLPHIERYLMAICKMRNWTDPQLGRDIDKLKKGIPQIALDSANLADEVATAMFWLGDRIPKALRNRTLRELDRRIFRPFEKSIRKKTGQMNWWIDSKFNWNPVCLCGTVRAALQTIESKERRAFFVAAAERSVRNLFKGFSPDGYYEEGIGYWNYGVGHYALMAESVHQATGGKVDWFNYSPAYDIPGVPTVVDMACYPERIEIVPRVMPAFADCGITKGKDGFLLTIFGRRLQLPLASESFKGYARRNAKNPDISKYRNLQILANLLATTQKPEIQKNSKNTYNLSRSVATSNVPSAKFDDKRSYFASHGVLVARPGNHSSSRLGIAILGGHNAENHNHNDVSTYVIACDGKAILVDPGTVEYTSQTFSSKRYRNKVLNSYGHPVPRVAGKLQRQGREAAAKVLYKYFSDTEDRIKMDITSAYDVETLRVLIRQFTYSRRGEGRITITDRVTFTKPEKYESALITFQPWKKLADDRIRVGKENGKGSLEITFHCNACPVKVKETIIKENLANTKRDKFSRLALVLTKPVKGATLTVTIKPCRKMPE